MFKNKSKNNSVNNIKIKGDQILYMKFILPQNYRFKKKIFGIIDYNTAIINLIIYGITYFFVNIIFFSIKLKIFVFILICFPCFLIIILSENRESIISVIRYFIKYLPPVIETQNRSDKIFTSFCKNDSVNYCTYEYNYYCH